MTKGYGCYVHRSRAVGAGKKVKHQNNEIKDENASTIGSPGYYEAGVWNCHGKFAWFGMDPC